MVKYKKCPRCELNYIEEDKDYCDVCLAEMQGSRLKFADLDEDEEDEDVVVGSRKFNVDAWVQEEAILSLPASAVHEEACDEDMWTDEPEEAAAALEKPNPFAALAGLKFGK